MRAPPPGALARPVKSGRPMKRIFLVVLAGGCGVEMQVPLSQAKSLSEIGLFDEIESRTLSDRAIEFEPAFKLWSDGAEKHRWLRTPDGSIPDDWMLPIGGRLFKEFGRGGRPIETRVLSREGEDEYFMSTFVWRADLSDADRIEEGVTDADGSGYEVPASSACTLCHGSSESRTLGWSKIQLATEIDRSDPIVEGLGYLHANCGHCHTEGGLAWRSGVDMILHLDLVNGELDATRVLESTVGRLAQTSPSEMRIAPGHPEQSLIIRRMKSLDGARMPPVGTHAIDEQGVLQVSRMIEALQ